MKRKKIIFATIGVFALLIGVVTAVLNNTARVKAENKTKDVKMEVIYEEDTDDGMETLFKFTTED